METMEAARLMAEAWNLLQGGWMKSGDKLITGANPHEIRQGSPGKASFLMAADGKRWRVSLEEQHD